MRTKRPPPTSSNASQALLQELSDSSVTCSSSNACTRDSSEHVNTTIDCSSEAKFFSDLTNENCNLLLCFFKLVFVSP